MEGKQKQMGVSLIVTWAIFGLLAGLLVGSIIGVSQKRLFKSRAIVEGRQPNVASVSLSRSHALLMVRDLDLGNKWQCRGEEAVATLIKRTTIRSIPEGVEIVVECPNRVDARDIASELANLFRTIDYENRLVVRPTAVPPHTDEEREAFYQRKELIESMKECAEEAGLSDFRLIPHLGRSGLAEAKAIWDSKKFRSWWRKYEELTDLIQGVDSGTEPVAALIAAPVIAAEPSSKVAQIYPSLLGLIGLLLGGFVGARRAPKEQQIEALPMTSFDEEDEYEDEEGRVGRTPERRRFKAPDAEENW